MTERDDENEITTMWKEIRHAVQNKHADNKTKNIDVLSKSGLNYYLTNNDETAVFREFGKPKVDFYPSSGRWKQMRGNKYRVFDGGAESFISWYNKHQKDT